MSTNEAVHSVQGAQSREQLHAYWTRGEGLAKWADTPRPWTALRAELAQFIHDPNELDRTTSQWFMDVMGFSAGSDLNRVTHGQPPRGHRIGPG
jgi:hypothetical protein